MTFAAFYAVIEGFVKANATAPAAEEPDDHDFLAALAEEMALGRA